MSLIELMVGIALLAIMLTLVMPSAIDWMRNTRLRSTAEALRSGFQVARAEAIRRNSTMRLHIVTSLDSTCALSTSGIYWVVNAGASYTPTSACNQAISTSTSPYLVAKSPVISSNASDLVVSATRTTVAFDALGRQAVTTNPATVIAKQIVQFSSSNGSCIASGGNVRCLNVIVSPAGDVRICDPSRSDSTDSLTC